MNVSHVWRYFEAVCSSRRSFWGQALQAQRGDAHAPRISSAYFSTTLLKKNIVCCCSPWPLMIQTVLLSKEKSVWPVSHNKSNRSSILAVYVCPLHTNYSADMGKGRLNTICRLINLLVFFSENMLVYITIVRRESAFAAFVCCILYMCIYSFNR